MNTGLIYNLIVALISLVAIGLMTITMFIEVPKETARLIDFYDYGLCLFFFIDFIRTFFKEENKFRYMITWGWLDLISSIPMVDFLRYGRFSRVIRLVRLIRIIKAGKALANTFGGDLQTNALFLTSVFAVLNILISSVLVLIFEVGPDVNIKTPMDSLWWSIVTMTTVGYGDHYPITLGGRLVAVFLMVTGISLFGVLTATLAKYLVKNDDNSEQYKELLSEIKEIKIEINKLRTDNINRSNDTKN